jgi:hypothetical protein
LFRAEVIVMRRGTFLMILLLGFVALTALPGCSRNGGGGSAGHVPNEGGGASAGNAGTLPPSPRRHAVGGPCSYYPAVTGTVTVSIIEPPDGSSPWAGGQPCSQLRYDWSGPGPDRFPNMDDFFANADCIAKTGLHVGSTFQVTRQDIQTGTCTPSEETILDPAVAACASACR